LNQRSESLPSSIKGLIGFRVQRLDILPDQCLCIEFFDGATRNKFHLLLDPKSNSHAASLIESRIKKSDSKPPSAQKVFRQELVPSRLLDADMHQDGMVFTLSFLQSGGKARNIHVEISPYDPKCFLTSVKPKAEKVVAAIEKKRSKRSKKGSAYHRRETADTSAFPPQRHPASKQEESTKKLDTHRELSRRFRATKKRHKRLVEALHRDLAKHQNSEQLYTWGEALKPVASQLARGRSSIRIEPPDGDSFEIPLSKHLDGIGNLERLFRQAKRALKAHENIHPRLDRLQLKLREIDTRLEVLADPQIDGDTINELEKWLRENGRRAKKQEQKKTRAKKRKPYRQYLSVDQIHIWVGRKAKDNDALTFRHASGNDTFFHVRGQGGSHVIVKAPLDRIQPETLIDAAHLALWFSRARGSHRADVQYTERKHVRRAEGGTPGLVYISSERVLHLVFDEKRIQRLIQTER
jgi:predicted ribosome quality control (RQC) complex YloA/Tae2 family protein